MSGMKKLDSWIIARVESAAHAFQRWTGRSNFWLASCVRLSKAFVMLAQLMAYWAGSQAHWTEWMGFKVYKDIYGLMSWIIALEFLLSAIEFSFQRLEAAGRQRLLQGLANPRKAVSWFRLSLLFSTVFCHTVWLGLLLLQEYLEACDPLPPCLGKLWEWLRLGKLQEASVEA